MALLARRNNTALKLKLDKVHFTQGYPESGGFKGPLQASDSQCVEGFMGLYTLESTLGAGSMSVVRRVIRKSDGMRLAAKQVTTNDEEKRKFTLDEYELMKTLADCPAIVRVVDFHVGRASLWICMELCTDGALQSYVAHNGAFAEPAAKALTTQLFTAVSYLHDKRVVHRDIKPANVLLTNNARELKLADFNSAKQTGNASGYNILLTDRATQNYSAPELRFGRMWNERVDVWACGLCIYYMLHGSIPFRITDLAVEHTLKAGKLPEVTWAGASCLMQNLILQCLTVDVFDRPPIMELMMHPVFRRKSTGSRERQKTGNEHTREKFVHTCMTEEAGDTSPTGYGEEPSKTWQEGRDGLDMFARLATVRCERMMRQGSNSNSNSDTSSEKTDEGSPSEESPPVMTKKLIVRRPRREERGCQPKDFTKFFTSHCAHSMNKMA